MSEVSGYIDQIETGGGKFEAPININSASLDGTTVRNNGSINASLNKYQLNITFDLNFTQEVQESYTLYVLANGNNKYERSWIQYKNTNQDTQVTFNNFYFQGEIVEFEVLVNTSDLQIFQKVMSFTVYNNDSY